MVKATLRVYSKTRKKDEILRIEFKPTYAKVKSEGGSYIVTKTSCTCFDHFYRSVECRHMNAVREIVASLKYW